VCAAIVVAPGRSVRVLFVSIGGVAVCFASYGGTILTKLSYFWVLPTLSQRSRAASAWQPNEQPDRGFSQVAAD
jgi:hypothetical protein